MKKKKEKAFQKIITRPLENCRYELPGDGRKIGQYYKQH